MEVGSLTPAFDLDLWEWKVTPDYKEPAKNWAKATCALSYSTPDNVFALWFSDASVRRYFRCGDVSVGTSRDDGLVNIVVHEPPAISPELLME